MFRSVCAYVSLKLLFPPSALYGLTASPLTQHGFAQLGIAQRKMMRNIVGWTRLPDDAWDDVYRQLRDKIHKATQKCPIQDWAEQLARQKQALQQQVLAGKRSSLTTSAVQWEPAKVKDDQLDISPKRSRGRPRARWI